MDKYIVAYMINSETKQGKKMLRVPPIMADYNFNRYRTFYQRTDMVDWLKKNIDGISVYQCYVAMEEAPV